jgi:hypothetical protein
VTESGKTSGAITVETAVENRRMSILTPPPHTGCFANSWKRSLMFWTMRMAVSALPLLRAMNNQMSSSGASAWEERR